MKPAVIQLDHVSKRFGSKHAVGDISLHVEQGTVVAILGPNGAGKTTTIRMMLGLSTPTSGRITVLGKAPEDQAVRQKIGVMLQDVSVMDGITVREMINLVRSYYPSPLDAEQIMQLTGLQPKDMNKRAEKLSGGQKRSLGFALAMAGDPEVLFFDEPTVGLDAEARRHFWNHVRELAGRGKTVIFTTHYLQEADEAADRIILFHNGKVAADGTPDSIKAGMSRRTLSFAISDPLKAESSPSSSPEPSPNMRKLVENLPGVDQIEYKKGRCVLYAGDTDALIRQIVERQLPVRDIRIEAGQLDEAYAQFVETLKEDV